MALNPDGTFTCPGCDEPKPLTALFFYHNSSSKTGFDNRCKVCRNDITRQQRLTPAGIEAKRRTDRDSARKTLHAKRVVAYAETAGIIREHVDSVLKELGMK